MSFRRRAFSRRGNRGRLGTLIDSNKNIRSLFTAAATGANTTVTVATAVDAAENTTTTQVTRGCKIFRIWLELWITASATAAEGVTTGVDAYIMKNPGANLTPPNPGTTGSSNEKKFIFKEWKGLIASRKEGFPAYTWRGWLKVPRVYQRMGADDTIVFMIRPTGVNALVCSNFVYKWYK